MNLQFLADGLIAGAMIGLGAIGVTLTYSILRFANFAHGEFLAWGAYLALARRRRARRRSSGGLPRPSARSPSAGRCSSPRLVAMALTGLLALARRRGAVRPAARARHAIIMVMASFGASMALRSLLEFIFTS